MPIYVPKNLRVMTTSTPHRHIKKRLIKTVGAHTLCSCGYMQDGGLYFHIKDYQGNVRVVLNQVNQPVEVNSYYPYGGLMAATTTEGTQPYKYSTKELDRENGLDWYDFHARQMDPMVPRFTTIDPKCEKYYAISPYAYCAANPISFTDPKGEDIKADELSRRNICNALTKEESEYVRFDNNGKLDVQLLNRSKSTSDNMIALKVLANSKVKYNFMVADKDHRGVGYYDTSETNGNFYRGTTEMPNAEVNPSPDDKVYIIVGKILNEKQQALTTAHEAFGHAYFYEIFRDAEKASHTYKQEGRMVWDEELMVNGLETIKIPTNILLEKRIKIVTNIAQQNYESRFGK